MPVSRPSTPTASPKQNLLLAALTPEELKRLRPNLEPTSMPLGHVVYEAGRALEHVYFPTTAIVSLLHVLEDGSSAEIAMVGNEGIVGVSLFMGGETTPSRAVVQSAGSALRLPGRLPTKELAMTQELIANMLGVRREGVTEAAGKLQSAGVINYHRGHITVLDRPKLESLSCECYAVVRRETERLLPVSVR